MNSRQNIRPRFAPMASIFDAGPPRVVPQAGPVETWTPKAVGEAMIAALRWAQWAAGRVGPGGMKTVALPFVASMDEHLRSGWGLPEIAVGSEGGPQSYRVMPGPAEVARHEAALEWPAVYLVPEHEGSAKLLGLWLGCKVGRRSFDQAVKARGTIARATAYRMRDRALSIISQGLDRDGVPL